MYCVDANILLRCLLKDDPAQTPKALEFMREAMDSDEDIYIPDVVVMEVVWVVERTQGRNAAPAFAALDAMVIDPRLRFDHPSRLQAALALRKSHAVSIVDAYLAAAVAAEAGSKLVTFDRQLQKLPVPQHPL